MSASLAARGTMWHSSGQWDLRRDLLRRLRRSICLPDQRGAFHSAWSFTALSGHVRAGGEVAATLEPWRTVQEKHRDWFWYHWAANKCQNPPASGLLFMWEKESHGSVVCYSQQNVLLIAIPSNNKNSFIYWTLSIIIVSNYLSIVISINSHNNSMWKVALLLSFPVYRWEIEIKSLKLQMANKSQSQDSNPVNPILEFALRHCK